MLKKALSILRIFLTKRKQSCSFCGIRTISHTQPQEQVSEILNIIEGHPGLTSRP